MIAILELVKQESDQNGNELLIGKRVDDEVVFAEQISVRLPTDKEYNIMVDEEKAVILIEKRLQQERSNEEIELLEFLATELKQEKLRVLLIESISKILFEKEKQTEAKHAVRICYMYYQIYSKMSRKKSRTR
ncbi:MAG: hypothetical protein ACQEXB_25955 [Bacillota bacterium]